MVAESIVTPGVFADSTSEVIKAFERLLKAIAAAIVLGPDELAEVRSVDSGTASTLREVRADKLVRAYGFSASTESRFSYVVVCVLAAP